MYQYAFFYMCILEVKQYQMGVCCFGAELENHLLANSCLPWNQTFSASDQTSPQPVKTNVHV